jgi:hypothetical protein
VPDYSYVDPLSFDADYDYSYDGIMRSVEFSYARLGSQPHRHSLCPRHRRLYAWRAKNAVYLQKQFLDGGIKALEELKSSGAIKAFGLGVNEVPVCLDVMRNADIDCILMAGRYTLLDRRRRRTAAALPAEGYVAGGRRRLQFRHSGDRRRCRARISTICRQPTTFLPRSAAWRRSRASAWRAAGGACPAVSAARSDRRLGADRHRQGRRA